MHVHFTVRTPRDVHVAGGVGDLEADRSRHSVIAVKAAAGGWPPVASDNGNCGHCQNEWDKESALAQHSSSVRPRRFAPWPAIHSYAKVARYVPDADFVEPPPGEMRVSFKEPCRSPYRSIET